MSLLTFYGIFESKLNLIIQVVSASFSIEATIEHFVCLLLVWGNVKWLIFSIIFKLNGFPSFPMLWTTFQMPLKYIDLGQKFHNSDTN